MSLRSLFHECRPFFRLLEDQSRLAPQAFYSSSRLSRHWSPWACHNQLSIDIADKGDSFVVEADLPGVKRENLEVKVGDRGRSLIIEGKALNRLGERERLQRRKDRDESIISDRSSSFMRKVWLPQAVDGTKVKAKLEDGVLSLHIPKVAEDGSVRVEVL